MLLLAALLWASAAAVLTYASAGVFDGAAMSGHLGTSVLITGNSTLISPNQTFEIGFFTVDGGSRWYLGIWYASIPIRTYVWVANRDAPVGGAATPATARITAEGLMAVRDDAGRDLWLTNNSEPAGDARLLDTGNLVLLSADGTQRVVWQSFDHPADTWLPEQSVSRRQTITSWRSRVDPSPGPYSFRLKPPISGEFELIYEKGGPSSPIAYWSTGNWTGDRFAGVPEMTVPYIYTFRFDKPFSADASFVYSEAPSAFSLLQPFLTRFVVDSSGQLRQFTWSAQTSSWNMFWARPEDPCKVYAHCGDLGLCRDGGIHPCDCLAGTIPADLPSWSSGDFAGGCRMDEAIGLCAAGNQSELIEIGPMVFDGAWTVSFSSSDRRSCEDACLMNCSCRGLIFDPELRRCRTLYGDMFNLLNSSSAPTLYLKVPLGSSSSSSSPPHRGRDRWKTAALSVGSVCVFLTLAVAAALTWMLIRMGKRKRRLTAAGGGKEEDDLLAMANLRVFTYKELSTATGDFSDELGHGGFGSVFRGELPDSSPVAVKRLERHHGGGDREFRAEVRTIGSIQHVNLVRLRGFCSEGTHRLLVYEYMPRGPLSAYLGRRRRCPPELFRWEERWRVALGTARGIAYLHEECRDCIVHCDIKPENILLDGDFTAKVSDFGLARLIGRDFSRVLATMRGTWGYVAPEWISGVAITAKADVYSYGMTLLELIAGRRNVEVEDEAATDDGDKWFFPAWAARQIVGGNVAAVVDPLLGGAYDGGEADRAAMVAVWCIQDQEEARPSMGQVVKMLQGTVDVAAPPLPHLLQALVSGDSFRRASSQGGGGGDDDRGMYSDGHSEISEVNGS